MILRALKTEFVLLLQLLILLVVGGLVGWVRTTLAAEKAATTYQVVSSELEPFRSAFNDASDHVRAVLLVGPT